METRIVSRQESDPVSQGMTAIFHAFTFLHEQYYPKVIPKFQNQTLKHIHSFISMLTVEHDNL